MQHGPTTHDCDVEEAVRGILAMMRPEVGDVAEARTRLLAMHRAGLLELHAGLATEMARTGRDATESWERFVSVRASSGHDPDDDGAPLSPSF